VAVVLGRVRHHRRSVQIENVNEVGLVSAHDSGRHRVYRLNGEARKPLHEWVKRVERFWEHLVDQIKKRAEGKRKPNGPTSS
jgi:hypothetical protein